jgi:hypothetical protein
MAINTAVSITVVITDLAERARDSRSGGRSTVVVREQPITRTNSFESNLAAPPTAWERGVDDRATANDFSELRVRARKPPMTG